MKMKMMIRMTNNSAWAGITLLILTAIPASSWAQEAGIEWSDLTPREQQVLAPAKDKWNGLPATKRENLQKGARRWNELDKEKRQNFKNRFKDWQKKNQKTEKKSKTVSRNFKAYPLKIRRLCAIREKDSNNFLRKSKKSCDNDLRICLQKREEAFVKD